MGGVTFRIDTDTTRAPARPATSAHALQLLVDGNRAFTAALDPTDDASDQVVAITAAALGIGLDGGIPPQEPFALAVSCADARVPLEFVFGRAVNDLFVLRVAGNVLGQEIIGSMDYALQNLPTLRVVVVLGHSRCGAVTAAVDAYLQPAAYLELSAEHQLRSIVHQLFPAVRLAHAALLRAHGDGVADAPGFRAALVEVSVAVNAAVMASVVRRELERYDITEVAPLFAVYDLATHCVAVPGDDIGTAASIGLAAAPVDGDAFQAYAHDVATSREVVALLDAGGRVPTSPVRDRVADDAPADSASAVT
jgi:carbonic anhydrase